MPDFSTVPCPTCGKTGLVAHEFVVQDVLAWECKHCGTTGHYNAFSEFCCVHRKGEVDFDGWAERKVRS